jgi:uncharacterized membrane protein
MAPSGVKWKIWRTSQSRGTHNHEKSALEVLKERYAKGKFNK